MVYWVCSKYSNYPDKEDLYQEGRKGLMEAYKNFDNSKNVKFSTYATPYIIGEVNKYVRENKNIKVSRDIIRLGRKIIEYQAKHKEVRGYEPSTEDIAKFLGISEEKVIIAMEAAMPVRSFDEVLSDDGKVVTFHDVVSQEERISKEQMMDLKEAFECLSIEEKELVIRRYFKDLTQSEVAQLMGVNQVQVSRLEKKAINKMRSKMAA